MEQNNRCRNYIKQVPWQVAKSYAKTAPHEYTVRKWRPELDEEFKWFVQYVRDNGVEHVFWKQADKYLYLDGFRYWTGQDPIDKAILINRCPAVQVFQ